MKRISSIFPLFLLALATTLFLACGEGSEHADHDPEVHVEGMHDGDHMDHAGHDHGEESALAGETVQASLMAYLQVKDALVQTDPAAAATAAKALVMVLGNGEAEAVQKMKTAADQIANSQDVEVQREAFNTLSDEIYEVVKASKAHDAPVYLQFCPMAFVNQGAYWLSTEKEVNNPYFGDKMLHCGSVEATL